MKSAPAILAALALWACGTSEPTSVVRAGPPSSNPPTGDSAVWIWVMVVDSTAACIPGATIQVVSGQAIGNPVTQQTPCTIWDDEGGVEFHGLAAGVPMTLRAAAAGYAMEDKTVTPFGGAQSAIVIELHPAH
jgi:hypothetical protein